MLIILLTFMSCVAVYVFLFVPCVIVVQLCIDNCVIFYVICWCSFLMSLCPVTLLFFCGQLCCFVCLVSLSLSSVPVLSCVDY